MSGRIAIRDALDKHAHQAIERNRMIRRATVTRLKPLTVDVHGSDIPLTLDDDFDMSQWMVLYQNAVGLKLGDLVLMHQEQHDWLLIDVVSDTAIPAKLGGKTGPFAWTPLPYQTGPGTGGWADVGTVGYEPGGYFKDSQNFVHIRGACANATGVSYPSTNTVIAILPSDSRPVGVHRFTASALDTGSHYIAPVMLATPNGRIMMAGYDVGQVPLGNNGSYQWLQFSTDFTVF